MNRQELTMGLEKELAVAGITDEVIINTYGNVENWCDCVIKTFKKLKN